MAAGPRLLTGRPREDGRITDEKDVRIWNLISMAGGATGILYPRWRPLLDGPLFGAFGAFGMDGSVTPRADMTGQMARWANEHPELWKSRPVKGDVGIVFVPESQIFNFVQQGATKHYAESARGAYQAFFDSNIQPDFVHIDDIKAYPLVYLPYPLHLKPETAKKLIEYVAAGGKLVSEGLPGYFGERGKVGTRQPNLGLDELFGARESYVEFTPDLLDNLKLQVQGKTIGGRFFIQKYKLANGAKAVGQFEAGETAAVEHGFQKGRALLIGTFPGAAYFLHHSPDTKAFFASLLDWAGIKQQIRVSTPEVKARLHTGASGNYLWILNPTRQPRTATVTMERSAASFSSAQDVWMRGAKVKVERGALELTIDERNAAILRLDP